VSIKRVLDLFCGAGGAAMGYYRAFGPDVEIVGVDHKPQPHYPFTFIQADALEFMRDGRGDGFDFYHASPPCQVYSVTAPLAGTGHRGQIEETRDLLRVTGKPHVIENVPGAPLDNPLMLCGTMFGLRIIRHRLFEVWPTPIWFPPAPCCHNGKATSANTAARHGGIGNPGFEHGFDFITVCGHSFPAEDGQVAMDIDWMNRDELAQAIPPAYTEWIGRRILETERAAP